MFSIYFLVEEFNIFLIQIKRDNGKNKNLKFSPFNESISNYFFNKFIINYAT